ncbi:hypothetical protein NA78x_006288 [Anatilimnocola sp. NA78]|uniref:hypothetical protein n=1 Tax=Anatilimnocola sp. NA78 TaxID=3415683 RepID=UPI003CE56231
MPLLLLATRPAAAVTPDSAEVKAVVAKALKFLETANHDQIGGKCLIGMVFKQTGTDANHPKIKDAIAACQAYAAKGEYGSENYNLGLCIIFLCGQEDEALKPTAKKLLTAMLQRQKQNGSWGYQERQEGDTSQTQYGVLAMWISERNGLDVPLPAIEGALNWLLRTQDKGGGWGYQGIDPGPNGARVEQSPLTMSLGAAALGSIFVLSDLLVLPDNITRGAKNDAKAKLPAALQEVIDKKAAANGLRRRPPTSIDPNRLRKAMDDGKAFVAKQFNTDNEPWKHYAFYAVERFESFREIVENDRPEEPKWFNDLFAYLKKTQINDGSWQGDDTAASCTAFTVLVLSRSTRKTIKRIESLGEGVLLGGMGLPPKTADLKERNGKIVDSPLSGSVDELLGILEDDSNPELARLAESKQVVTLDPDITRRAGQIDRLRAMVSAGAYETRLVAVRSLAKVRDLDNVPVLLYALSDPDVRIIREADRGLRFNSHKLTGVIELDAPTQETLAALRSRWRAWYLSIRPDAELLD